MPNGNTPPIDPYSGKSRQSVRGGERFCQSLGSAEL